MRFLTKNVVSYIDLLVFILPSYLANSTPVLLGGGTPMDFGKRFFDGQRILGKSKTWRGFFAGVAAGTAGGALISLVYFSPFFATPQLHVASAFLLALGTMTGDAMGSFMKRRMKLPSGKPFFLDSILFLAVALAFALPATALTPYAPEALAFLIILTIILHPLSNWVANRLGMKRVPW